METADMLHLLKRLWRSQLSPSTLMSLQEVVEALPLEDELARTWVLSNVEPIGLIAQEPLYRWGDVIAETGRVLPEALCSNCSEPNGSASEEAARSAQGPGLVSPWLTVSEAAQYFQVSERLLRRLLSEGAFGAAALRMGRRVRLHRERLVEVLSEKEEQDGVAPERDEAQPRHWTEEDVFQNMLERSPREEAHPGYRVLERGGSQESPRRIREKDRSGSSRGSAADFRAWLEAEPDAEDTNAG